MASKRTEKSVTLYIQATGKSKGAKLHDIAKLVAVELARLGLEVDGPEGKAPYTVFATKGPPRGGVVEVGFEANGPQFYQSTKVAKDAVMAIWNRHKPSSR